MKFDVTYQGEAYPYDTDQLTLAELFTVKAITGLSGAKYNDALFEMEPAAVLAMVVLAVRRGGKPVLADDIAQDEVDLGALAMSMLGAVEAALKAASEDDSEQDTAEASAEE